MAARPTCRRARRAPSSTSPPGCGSSTAGALLELPTTHSLGAIARVAPQTAAAGRPRALPRLRAARRAPARRAHRDAARCSRGGGDRPGSTSSPPTARFPGTPYARLIGASPRRCAALAGLRLRRSRVAGDLRPDRHEPVPDHDPPRREDGRHRGRACTAPLPARLDGRPVLADEGHLEAGRRLPGRDERAGRATATVKVTQTATGADDRPRAASGDRRAAGVRRVRLRAARALPRRRRERRGGRPPRPDPRRRGRLPVLVRPDPVLRELGGLGAPAREPEPARRWPSPARPAGRAARSRTTRPARSRRSPTARRSASRAPSCTSTSTSARSPRRSPTTWPRRASPSCRRPPSSS